MSATSIDLFLFASSLASASPVGSHSVRATQAHRRVPAGTWVYPGSNEKRDDVIVALAKRGVVLLGDPSSLADVVPRPGYSAPSARTYPTPRHLSDGPKKRPENRARPVNPQTFATTPSGPTPETMPCIHNHAKTEKSPERDVLRGATVNALHNAG
jgi:hypothetical protein